MKSRLLLFTLLFASFLASSQIVELNQGHGISVFQPLCMTHPYGAVEAVYFGDSVGVSGVISKLAYERVDGTFGDPIDSVRIYLKHTSLTQLSNGNYVDTGYTLVYSGSFPNDTGSGWREVTLNTPFTYDNTNNLEMLVVRGYQDSVANTPVTPRWYYTLQTAANRCRRYNGHDPVTAATPLISINFTPNIRLDFGSVGVVELRSEQLQVFPNPANDFFTVTIPANGGSGQILIHDLLGKKILERNVLPRNGRFSENISTNGFAPGVYVVSLSSSGKNFNARICIE